MADTPNTDIFFNCSNDTDPEIRVQDNYEYIFTAKCIRDVFIRKVYGVLIVQLCATLGIICFFLFYEPVAIWIRLHPGTVFVVDLVSVIFFVMLTCCGEGLRRRAPGNFITLFLFTIAQGSSFGVTATNYQVYSVILSYGITIVVCFAVVLFSFQAKLDFTQIGGYLFVTTVAVGLFGILALLNCARPLFHILSIILAPLFAWLFCLYLVYDTQMVVCGKQITENTSVLPHEYVYACLSLYLDIINNFLYVICIFGSNGDD